MLTAIRSSIRAYLGTDAIPRMEQEMATAKAQLEQLNTKVDDLIADVRAARDTLAQERENLTTGGQAAFDTLSAKVDAFDAEVGDADGSDTVTPPAPVEPENPNNF